MSTAVRKWVTRSGQSGSWNIGHYQVNELCVKECQRESLSLHI